LNVNARADGRHGWRHTRLAPRIVGISVVLLLLVQAVVFAIVRVGIERQAQAVIAKELATSERVWRRLLDQNAARLRQGAQLLAGDYGFRTAVATADRETVLSALENHGKRIGSVLTAFLDVEGRLVTRTDLPATALSSQDVDDGCRPWPARWPSSHSDRACSRCWTVCPTSSFWCRCARHS